MHSSYKISPRWFPGLLFTIDEATGEWRPTTKEEKASFIDAINKRRGQQKTLKQLTRPSFNQRIVRIIYKHGAFMSAIWPTLMLRLVEVGLRKRSLSYRPERARNMENLLCWIGYNFDIVTGVFNTNQLLSEICQNIGVSSTTLYDMVKELAIMGIVVDSEFSAAGRADLINGGRLPRTMKVTPLFFELFGISEAEVAKAKRQKITREKKVNPSYNPLVAEKEWCTSNTYRVWQARHNHLNDGSSGYKSVLSAMPFNKRLSYISKHLTKRIMDKKLNIDTSQGVVQKMARNLLGLLGLGPSVEPAT